MAIKTAISYCDSTVSPTPCCSGCELFHVDLSKNHCFAHRMSRRWSGKNKGWPESFTEYQFFPGRIEKACRWSDLTGTKRPDKPHLDGMPRVIFFDDLGDAFAPIAPLDWAAPYIDMMAESPHIWLWLTKWPHRMFNFFADLGYVPDNFWLGTTITSQETTWRIKQLLRLRSIAKMLWVSAEPLLEEIDLHLISSAGYRMLSRWYGPDGFDKTGSQPEIEQPKPDWIAAGGMSGSNAVPTHPDAFRSLQDQCQAADVRYYFKQHGIWLHASQLQDQPLLNVCEHATGKHFWPDGSTSYRLNSKLAGHLLDGKEWTEMPG